MRIIFILFLFIFVSCGDTTKKEPVNECTMVNAKEDCELNVYIFCFKNNEHRCSPEQYHNELDNMCKDIPEDKMICVEVEK